MHYHTPHPMTDQDKSQTWQAPETSVDALPLATAMGFCAGSISCEDPIGQLKDSLP